MRSYKAIAADIGFHAAEFSFIALKTATFLGHTFHQLFLELHHYDRAPDQHAQETWISLVLFSASFAFSGCAKLANHLYLKRNPESTNLALQDYAWYLFSSVYGFMLIDLIRGAKKEAELPIGIYALCLIITITPFIFADKEALPDSGHTLSLRSRIVPDYFLLDPLHSETRLEKVRNATIGAGYGFRSIVAALLIVDREFIGQTAPLPFWQYGFVVTNVLVGLFFGARLSAQPRQFDYFAKFSNGLKSAAFIYFALSGLARMIAVCTSEDGVFSMSNSMRVGLAMLFSVIATSAFFMGFAETQYRFDENKVAGKNLIAYLERGGNAVLRAGREVAGCCSSAQRGGDNFELTYERV